jgi:hypothetical protein
VVVEVEVRIKGGPHFETTLAAVRRAGRVWALEQGESNGVWVALVEVEVPDPPEDAEVSKPGVFKKRS